VVAAKPCASATCVGRWIAGAGHELGHAFCLTHRRARNAIMGAGFYHCWPDRCALTPKDRRILARGAYFAAGPDAEVRLLERRWYSGGVFLRLEDQARRRYGEERKTDAGFAARFVELSVTRERILARDESRGLTLELPRGDGLSRLSSDDGSTWAPLYEVEAEVVPPMKTRFVGIAPARPRAPPLRSPSAASRFSTGKHSHPLGCRILAPKPDLAEQGTWSWSWSWSWS
jgi:hypothetical protein